MELSEKAILELKETLKKLYGENLDISDCEVKEIGMFLLTSLAEGLKLKVSQSNL